VNSFIFAKDEMQFSADQPKSLNSAQAYKVRPLAAQNSFVRSPTSTIERFLLLTVSALLPLESNLPTPGGFSVLFLLFGALWCYVLFNRGHVARSTALHPVFVTAYFLFLFGVSIESLHSNPQFSQLFRFLFMVIGGVAIASVCRDARALRASLYGYIGGSLWVSVLLFLTTYGSLSAATATSYQEATQARIAASERGVLELNLNELAFLTAQGAVVALAFFLTTHSAYKRRLFLGAALFCLLGSFLPMSRSAVLIAVVSSLAVLFKYGKQALRIIGLAIVCGAIVLAAVPNVVFTRFASFTEGAGRTQVSTASIGNLSEYIITGVGAGNYWGRWGETHGFRNLRGNVIGAHNAFLQMTIFWGLPLLSLLIVLLWQAYHCLPTRYADDGAALAVLGIAVSLLIYMFFFHSFWDKYFSLGLGLLVGARRWIWPSGIVQRVRSN
jgi:hypothetical protein